MATRLPLTTRSPQQGPPLSYRAFVPARRGDGPPLVLVHGNSRALRWMDHLEEAAQARDLPPRVSFDLLAGTGHSFAEAVERGGLVERTFEFLHPRAEESP